MVCLHPLPSHLHPTPPHKDPGPLSLTLLICNPRNFFFLFLFLMILFIYLFIYLRLCWVFAPLQTFFTCGEWGLLSSCGAQASYCRGFS